MLELKDVRCNTKHVKYAILTLLSFHKCQKHTTESQHNPPPAVSCVRASVFPPKSGVFCKSANIITYKKEDIYIFKGK